MMTKLSESIVSFYRNWAEFVKTSESLEISRYVLIDDLASTTTALQPFNSKADVARALESLIEESTQTESQSLPYAQYTTDKLRQSLAYLNYSLGSACDRATVEDRGLKWSETTESQLKELQAKAKLSTDRHIETSKANGTRGIRAIFDEVIPTKNAAGETEALSWERLRLLEAFIPNLHPALFSTVTVDSSAPWSNMIIHEAQDLELVVNTSANRLYTVGSVDQLSTHEVCGHVLHFSQLKRNRRLQEEVPHLLCMAIHTQDAYWLEGVAQFLHGFFVSRVLPPGSFAEAAYDELRLWVALQGANVMDVMSGKLTVLQATDRTVSYLGGDANRIRSNLEAVLKDPFFVCQKLAYHSSIEALDPLYRLSTEALLKILPDLLNEILDPSGMDEFVRSRVTKAIL